MKTKKIILNCLFSVVFLFEGIYIFSQNYSSGDSLVVFYPDDFDSAKTLPSLAILNEPEVLESIPADWKLIPQFYLENGKNCAKIIVGPDVDFYGTGEVTGSLRRNNTGIMLWNTDNYAYIKDGGKRLYQSHPWVLGVRSDGTSFGIIADNTWKQDINLGDSVVSFISDGPPFRIIIFEGQTPQNVVEQLAGLIGKISMPPLWALGYHQCRYSYYPESQVKDIANNFRTRKIPCDVIWLDINYMDGFRIFTFDPSGFPDPPGLNNYLHDRDFKSIWMIDPGVKKETGYPVYDQGKAGDHFVLNSSRNEYNGNVWPGPCAFPDFTRPETQSWWSGLYPAFLANGIDGIWNDMNEPSVFGGPDGTMPTNNIHRGGNGLPEDVHLRYHNVYGMLMVKATYEGMLLAYPDKRPFVLTRSNFLGGNRYAATWTGDNVSSWDHLKMSVPMSVNLGISGQPFSGPDIGGFSGTASNELFANWMAVGAFYPFCRNHAASKQQEPWVFGSAVEQVSRIALQRRYRLLPYIYTLFYQASKTGIPIMQPVFFADPEDLTLRREEEAFLFGDKLLVVPKWAENPSLPSGIWRSISLAGEDSKKDKYQPDIRLKSGSILPIGQVIQSTEDYSTDSLTLLISPDENHSAYGILYDDALNGFDYLNGDYLISEFHAEALGKDSLIITCTSKEGNYSPGQRNYRICIVADYGMFYNDWTTDTVIKACIPPQINGSIVSPLNNAKFNSNDNITIQVNADCETEINRIEFYICDTILIGNDFDEPYEFIWNNVQPGIYEISARIIESELYQLTTDPVKIYVGEFGEGSILRQYWSGIYGTGISDLLNDDRFPLSPTSSTYLSSFEAPVNIGNYYGTRIVGYLTAPRSGNYTFFISGNEFCELYLSTDENEKNKVKIAEVPALTNFHEWTKYTAQQSAQISLSEGGKYFIEALHKANRFDDHITVAWEGPSMNLEVIPGDYLSPYQPELKTKESYNSVSLQVFPNPAGDKFIVLLNGIPGSYRLTLYDISGRKIIQSEVLTGIKKEICTKNYMNGIYIIEIKSENLVIRQKLIVQK